MFHITELSPQYFRIEALSQARALGYLTRDLSAPDAKSALSLYHDQHPTRLIPPNTSVSVYTSHTLKP